MTEKKKYYTTKKDKEEQRLKEEAAASRRPEVEVSFDTLEMWVHALASMDVVEPAYLELCNIARQSGIKKKKDYNTYITDNFKITWMKGSREFKIEDKNTITYDD